MGVTKKQRQVIEYMATNPLLNDSQVARDCNTTPQSICRWRKKDAEFNAELDAELKKVWKGYAKQCQKLMMDLATNGDYRAISYILDSNKYKAPTEVELTTNDIRITIDD